MLTKLGRTRTGQRLARLETTYREQRLKIKKEGIMAALAKMTRDERHDRIRFLIAKGMRAHGLREGDAGYVEAAIRGFEHTWPQFRHLVSDFRAILTKSDHERTDSSKAPVAGNDIPGDDMARNSVKGSG
jgi:hypothetical protein